MAIGLRSSPAPDLAVQGEGGGVLPGNQLGQVEAWNNPILHDPFAGDHDAIGAMSSRQNQRGKRVQSARKAQLVQGEKGKIGCGPDFYNSELRPPMHRAEPVDPPSAAHRVE